jgi:hypothetical protein
MACPAPLSGIVPYRDDIVLILLLRPAIVRKLRADIKPSNPERAHHEGTRISFVFLSCLSFVTFGFSVTLISPAAS